MYFNAMARFDEVLFLDALDISTIFGNALDNAEGSEKLPQNQRIITLKSGVDAG